MRALCTIPWIARCCSAVHGVGLDLFHSSITNPQKALPENPNCGQAGSTQHPRDQLRQPQQQGMVHPNTSSIPKHRVHIPLHPHPASSVSEALCQEQEMDTGIQRGAWQSLSLWDQTPDAGRDLEAAAEAAATALEHGMRLMSLAGLLSSAVSPFGE